VAASGLSPYGEESRVLKTQYSSPLSHVAKKRSFNILHISLIKFIIYFGYVQ
jgi:hypothetical protein